MIRKKKTVITIIFGASIGIALMIFFMGTPWAYFQHKTDFKAYLEDKYYEEFVIESMSYDIFHKSYNAYAYSKKNPEIIFHVGELRYQKSEFTDAYGYETWRYEVKKDIAPLIEKTYPDRHNYAVEIADFTKVGRETTNEFPSYKDAVLLTVGVSMAETVITDDNKLQELERAFILIDFLNKEGIKLSSFDVSFKNKYLRLEGYHVEKIKSPDELVLLDHNR